ncbi:MAG TPA: imidazoleglycerol-phosphate dehydratase HisB [Clostridiaceae bacterium]
MEDRVGSMLRKTMETEIEVYINIDGEGSYDINTGIGFFDHMLSLMSKHGLIDMNIKAQGDLYVDPHHTVEDVGIVLGEAIKKALRDKAGIKRYGYALVPMDEALLEVVLDISGRPYLVFQGEFKTSKLGGFDTELTKEFFRALAFNAGITLHTRVLYGENTHHMIEGLFKALGRALRDATTIDERVKGVMSTKGIL